MCPGIKPEALKLEMYTGRYHSKIGLNLSLMIFPITILFLFGQKYIPLPVSTRIIVVNLILLAIPNIIGVTGAAFGFKGYREGDTAFGMLVIILAAVSTIALLWFTFWILHDMSLLYRYGFLTPK